ncbi:Protein P like protein [Argiope bruennichi]|uniref:Protein P like protein n=1 Tax=Argiope bruennichi TaxID=94029 RepID=A0A8T0EB12_ARGBR|nr:Protein P like protein [Argiope bruennichi]
MSTPDETANKMAQLKRKRKTIRGNITRFSVEISNLKDDFSIEDVEYICNRLTTTLNEMKITDNEIHNLLSDEEYENDILQCESYNDNAEFAIFKAKKIIQNKLAPTAATNNFTDLAINNNNLAMNLNPCITTPAIQSYTVKLPTIKLEPFNGDVELWQSFWEQFQSSIDNNPNLSVIDKHVFLRGYLQDEPKRLVDGISIIADTYEATKKLLMDKYGDKNRIIQAHLDFLENLTPIQNPSPTSLNEVFIECNRRLQALRALGEDEEVEGALTTLKIRGEQSVQYDFKPSTAKLYVNSKNTTPVKKRSPFCAFCDTNGHWPQDCNVVTDINSRKQKLKNSNRCFLCTNRGHNVNNCPRKDKARCYKCKKRHHVSICKTVSENPNLTTIPVTSINNVDIITPKFTHLQTARVYVIGPTGKTKVTRCLLDGGSQSSFIHPNLIDFLQLEITGSEKLNLQAFESISTNTETRRKVKFILSSIWSNSKINIQAFESSNTYAFHPSTPQPVSSFAHSQKLKLADPSDSLNDLPIEILIGAYFYWTIVHTKSPIRLSATHVLIPTVFGWILSGNRSFTTKAYSSVSSVLNISSETLVRDVDDHVRRFWDLETIGIKTMQDKGMTIRNSEILSDFHNLFCKVDGSRVVKLPWKPENRCNRTIIDNQHVELADNSPCNESKLFYLPHHIVKKQKNGEKKWRIVFDTSSHTPGHPSLNDALEQGPNLLPEIFATLLRFRLHKFAITSDGRQAFLQLILDEEDRNCTRFLWFRTEKDANGKIHLLNEILTYRFSRLPFGLTSSPFLLSATLRELANMHSDSYPTAAKHLENNIFMDDFVMGVDTAEQATTLYQEMQDLMTQIGLPLAKWSTNSKNLQAIWELMDIIFKCNTQVLEINWNTKEDVFHTDINESVYQFAVPATKRLLLKIVSKLYDPLGLYAPAVVVGKILFQTTWLMGVQWDEILPPDIAASFNRWVSEISSLNKIHIPRWIGISATSHMSIHVFCDASEKAYGAALYICFTELNETKVRLVCSRKRLSPLKKVTLPRLELLAALLGARLLHIFARKLV